MKLLKIRKLLSALENACKEQSSAINHDINYTKGLISDLTSLSHQFSEVNTSCKMEFKERFFGQSQFFDFVVYQHISLFLLLAEKFYIKDVSFQHIEKDSDSFMAIRHFTLSLCNLSNSLLSIKLLVESGFNLQANQLIRSYIEFADISIATLAKNEFFTAYMNAADEKKEKEIWWNYTRPKAITKILREIFIEMHETEEYWEDFNSIREPVYSHLSGYVHSHVMANSMNAISQKLSSGNYELTLLGSITDNTKHTLKRIVTYSHFFINSSIVSIVKFRKLPFMHFGELGEKFIVNYKIGEIYFPIHMEHYYKDK